MTEGLRKMRLEFDDPKEAEQIFEFIVRDLHFGAGKIARAYYTAACDREDEPLRRLHVR